MTEITGDSSSLFEAEEMVWTGRLGVGDFQGEKKGYLYEAFEMNYMFLIGDFSYIFCVCFKETFIFVIIKDVCFLYNELDFTKLFG